jgi:hypothetical protein
MDADGFFENAGIAAEVELLHRLANSERPYRYTYMSLKQFTELKGVSELNQVYWYEIIERAHCASVMSLLRLHRWISLVGLSAEERNFVGFAASFRGVIESAADTRYALADVPTALASAFSHATKAVRGKLNTLLVAPVLETNLIHFSHGRKLPKGEEPLHEGHIAKTMQEYLNALAEGSTGGPIHECYAELCNITHPAADSVLYLLEKREDDAIVFCANADESAIRELCDRWGSTLGYAVSDSMLYPIMTLKIVNRYGLRELQTAVADSISLEKVPAWHDLEGCLNSG